MWKSKDEKKTRTNSIPFDVELFCFDEYVAFIQNFMIGWGLRLIRDKG